MLDLNIAVFVGVIRAICAVSREIRAWHLTLKTRRDIKSPPPSE
jgi:hypothetical protein